MADGPQVTHSGLPERVAEEDHHKEHYTYADYRKVSPEPSAPESPERNKGQRSLWPIVVAVTVTALVVGAALGGGLGSQLRSQSCNTHSTQQQCGSETLTVTATVTSPAPAATTTGGLLAGYVAASPYQISSVALDCPGRDGESYATGYDTDQTPQTFSIRCDVSLDASGDGASGHLAQIVAYHLNDCIEACSAYGDHNTCKAITMHVWMNYDGSPTPFNCWLFGNSTSALAPDSTGTDVSAYLQSS